jgi:hypothetical protein
MVEEHECSHQDVSQAIYNIRVSVQHSRSSCRKELSLGYRASIVFVIELLGLVTGRHIYEITQLYCMIL